MGGGQGVQSDLNLSLNEVSDVQWHLLDLGVVELLNVLKIPDIRLSQEVDRDTLTAEATRATNPVETESDTIT